MHALRWYGSRALTGLLLLVAQLLLVMPAGASPAALPAQIEVPAGYTLLFSTHARGVQIYTCRDGQWAFHAPRAALFDPEAKRHVGTHYGGVDQNLTPGPWWESRDDGSRIRAGNPVSAPSPNANSIPLLRLEVLERQGSGMFSQVGYIQRLNTVGGVGPTGACQTGARRQVPYSADYAFYGAS